MVDNTTSHPAELKSQITQKYFQLGLAQGFSKVHLDQIASELSISKKTIYKFFNGKEEIISACIDLIFSQIDTEVLPIMKSSSISIPDKLSQLPKIVAKHLHFFTTYQIVELQKTYPLLWDKLIYERRIRIERYEQLFQAAKDNGYLIDVDAKVLVQFYLNAVSLFTDENFLNEHQLSYSDALNTISQIVMTGIMKNPNC